MAITLIGYRGSGKSSVAPRLAAALGWPWIDADVELERRVGRTIRELFATEGETVFRDWEQSILAELTARPHLVIAAGGGAVLRPENRESLKRSGPVVWLRADIETLYARIHKDPTTSERRPNLTATGGRAEIEQLLALREPLYREVATIIVDAGNRPVEEIVQEILARLPDGTAAHEEGSPA